MIYTQTAVGARWVVAARGCGSERVNGPDEGGYHDCPTADSGSPTRGNPHRPPRPGRHRHPNLSRQGPPGTAFDVFDAATSHSRYWVAEADTTGLPNWYSHCRDCGQMDRDGPTDVSALDASRRLAS